MKTDNSFNFLRLLLAVLVILSHSYEIKCPQRSCEPLTLMFGSISLGELAVSGFFMVSGYLITASWVNNPSVSVYMTKRSRRIYPAFVACNFISLLLLAPIAKGSFEFLNQLDWTKFLFGVLTLSQPKVDNIYPDPIYNALNIPLWSIQYEFVCYVSLMAMMLVFRRRSPLATWFAFAAFSITYVSGLWWVKNGAPAEAIYLTKAFVRLPMFFLAGALVYFNKGRIAHLTPLHLTFLTTLLFFGMFSPVLAEVTLAVAGSVLLIRFGESTWAASIRFTQRQDVSYGVYLYAFPISQLLYAHLPDQGPFANFVLTTLLALIAGYLSWTAIEKPFLKFKRKAHTVEPQAAAK